MRTESNKIWIIVIVILLFLIAIALVWFGVVRKRQGQLTPNPNVQRTEPLVFETHEAWYKGRKIACYEFGPSSMQIGSLYTLVTGFDSKGDPLRVDGQNDIFSAKRGEANYSDFWEIKYVTVPKDYKANTIKSAKDIINNQYLIKESGKVVDQPQILENDTMSPDRIKITSWADNQTVFSWRVDNEVKKDPNNKKNIANSNLYILYTGYDDKTNTPLLVQGQQNIIDAAPGDADYSPLRQIVVVKVPSDYKAQNFKSADDIKKSGYETTSIGGFDNVPVYSIEGKTVPNFGPSSAEIKDYENITNQ